MKRSHQIVAVLVLGAWAATLAQADARPRSGKHPANAVGHTGTHQPAGAAKARGNASSAAPAPVRNAIGVATQPAAVGASGVAKATSGAATVKPNAIDTHIGTTVVPPSVSAGASKIGSTTNPANAVRAAPSPPPTHASGINGTGLTRPSGTLGTLGGPAKVAGGISGTGMRRAH